MENIVLRTSEQDFIVKEQVIRDFFTCQKKKRCFNSVGAESE